MSLVHARLVDRVKAAAKDTFRRLVTRTADRDALAEQLSDAEDPIVGRLHGHLEAAEVHIQSPYHAKETGTWGRALITLLQPPTDDGLRDRARQAIQDVFLDLATDAVSREDIPEEIAHTPDPVIQRLRHHLDHLTDHLTDPRREREIHTWACFIYWLILEDAAYRDQALWFLRRLVQDDTLQGRLDQLDLPTPEAWPINQGDPVYRHPGLWLLHELLDDPRFHAALQNTEIPTPDQWYVNLAHQAQTRSPDDPVAGHRRSFVLDDKVASLRDYETRKQLRDDD